MNRFHAGRTARALAGGVALAVMAHASAHAQEVPAPAAAPINPTTATGLGDIVVTAQKREENLQKTPIAITALSADRIDQGGLDQPQKLQFAVPSMTYGETAGFTYISLRGVGSDNNTLSESSVATYQDGVYTGLQIAEAVPTFDLQRVEVLRGPQGTLYGRNTTGGVINYVTKDPSFEFAGAGEVSYGNYNAVEVNAGMTGPIVDDKIAARVSFHYSDHDGYYPNIQTHEQTYAGRDIGGRIAVLIRPADNLKIMVRGDMAQQTSTNAFAVVDAVGLDGGLSDATHPLGIFSQPAAYFTAHPGLLSPADIAKLNGGSIASYYGLMQPGVAPPNPLTTGTIANASPAYTKVDSSGASLTATWDTGPVSIKSISAYRYGHLYNTGDTNGMPYSSLYSLPIEEQHKQFTQELNFSGKAFDNKLDWLVGGFYYHDDGFANISPSFAQYGQYLEANANLANPAGSAYAYNLNPATLTPLNNLPGVFPSIWQTAVWSGPNYPGDAAGSYVTAGQTIPSTAFAGLLQTQTSKSYAAFFQATYHVTDKLRVTGGFRYTIDQKDVHHVIHNNFGWALAANGIYEAVQAGYLPAAAYNPATIAAAAGVCDTRLKKTWRAPTGMVSVDYDASEHVLTYAKASWGYKAGGMNTSQCTESYNPEYLADYEGGVKAVLADGQLLTNLALYYYDYSNIQFITYAQNSAQVLNAGSAKAFGVEFEYAIRPRFARGWQLDGAASFEDSHYGDGCFGDPANLNNAGYLSTPMQACPATVINPNTGQAVPIGPSANIKGNQLVRAPRWKTNVGLQYASDVTDFGSFMARVDAAWTDTIYNDIWNGKIPYQGLRTQPGYWVMNALLSWSSPDKRYSVEAFGENLTDTRYAVNRTSVNSPSTMYVTSVTLASPRTFGIRLKARIGRGVF